MYQSQPNLLQPLTKVHYHFHVEGIIYDTNDYAININIRMDSITLLSYLALVDMSCFKCLSMSVP